MLIGKLPSSAQDGGQSRCDSLVSNDIVAIQGVEEVREFVGEEPLAAGVHAAREGVAHNRTGAVLAEIVMDNGDWRG